MKRLLLAPLLFLLAGCSNDLTIKSNIGEKILIKNSTVFLDNKSFDDLIKIVEANTAEELLKENEDSEYYRKQLPIEQGYLKSRLSRGSSKELIRLTNESINLYTRRINESDNRIFNIKERGKSLIEEIKEKRLKIYTS